MCSHEAELSERVSQQDCSGHSPLLPPPVFWLLLPPPHSLHYWRGFSALTGRQLKMVCDCLVLVGATAKTSWSEVASSLTHYLTHHPDQLPHLLVCLSSILHLIVSEFLHLSLPAAAILCGIAGGPQRRVEQSSETVVPLLSSPFPAGAGLGPPQSPRLVARLPPGSQGLCKGRSPPHTHIHAHKTDSIMESLEFQPPLLSQYARRVTMSWQDRCTIDCHSQ